MKRRFRSYLPYAGPRSGASVVAVSVLWLCTGCTPPIPEDQPPIVVADALADVSADAGLELPGVTGASAAVLSPFQSSDAACFAEIGRQESAVRVLMAFLEDDRQPLDHTIDFRSRRLTAAQQAALPGRMVRDVVGLKIRYRGGGAPVRLTPEVLEAIANLPRLERLYLERSDLDDDGCRRLAKIKTLRRLAIWGSNVTDAGVARLVTLPNLEVLDIHETNTTVDAAESIVRMPKLQKVYMGQYATSDPAKGEMLRYIAQRPELFFPHGELWIRDYVLRLGQMTFLADLDAFDTLRIDNAHLPDGGLQYVATMPNLRALQLLAVDVSPEELESFCARPGSGTIPLARIEALSLKSMNVSKEMLERVARMPELETLTLTNSRVPGEAMAPLAEAQIESLSGCPVDGLPHLAGNRSIRSLHLEAPSAGPCDPETLIYLRDLPNLEVLFVSDLHRAFANPAYPGSRAKKETVDAVMRHVLACPRLKVLALDKWEVDDEMLERLAEKLSRLEYLSMTIYPGMTGQGFKSLKKLPLENLGIDYVRGGYLTRLRSELPECNVHRIDWNLRADVVQQVLEEDGGTP